MIHRSDLESFELMELVHVNDGREVRYWGLDANPVGFCSQAAAERNRL